MCIFVIISEHRIYLHILYIIENKLISVAHNPSGEGDYDSNIIIIIIVETVILN